LLRRVSDDQLLDLMRAIARRESIADALTSAPDLATEQLAGGATRSEATDFFLDEIAHYVYGGDTLLHIAAAAADVALVRQLGALSADVGAVNRHRQQPLHYAVDGGPGGAGWDPPAQAATVAALLELGADPDATDKNGTTPLMRAVRNRCALAVGALLDAGADVHARNKRGSTAMQLAEWTTGRGGTGSPEAREQQAQIIARLQVALGP
jgi:ankyrin repeat protein